MNWLTEFKNIVKTEPDKTALVDSHGNRSITYKELDVLSGRAAGKLKSLGCVSGRFLVLNFERCIEHFVAVLAVLKAGCAYVPTAHDYPKSRMDFIVNDCNAFAVLDKNFFKDVENYEIYEDPGYDDAPAILIYTSGSTGKPKGILHTVGGLNAAIPRFRYVAGDIKGFSAVTMSSFSFVASTREFFTFILGGGTLHVITKDIFSSAEGMISYLTENQIDMANIPIQMLKVFDGKTLPLKRITTGSELVSNLYCDSCDTRNIYGMSETLSSFCYFSIDKKYDNTPVGKSGGDTIIHIVDEDGKEVSNGTEGEIMVEGFFDASYYKNPELTEKTFEKLPNGKTLIHTGDIGYKNENGDLVFVSRKDWMVKVNGQRVELLEVERAIAAVNGVSGAAVTSFIDASYQTYIVGYYTSNACIAPENVKDSLSKTLPSYMLPKFIVKLDEFPKTASGKINRPALLPPSSADFRAEYENPENETEEKLVNAFSEVLGCGKIGRNDDFFALGGDSIKVMQLIVLLDDDTKPEDILLGKTPKNIAAIIKDGAEEKITHISSETEVCPLTDAQLGIYFECISEPESVMYNIVKYMELPENIDVQRFTNALKEVVSSHKAFFATVKNESGIPEMCVKECNVSVPVVVSDNLNAELMRFIKPHDLENGPLFRFEICRHAKGVAFMFDVHHLIFDGTSVNNFVKQTAAVYGGADVGAEEITLFDVSQYEKTLKTSEKYGKAENYFKTILEDANTSLSIVPDVVSENPEKGSVTYTEMSDDFFDEEKITSFAKKLKITENTVFLGAFAYAFAKFAGSNEACFTTANNGRHDKGLMNSIGMFVKTLPISRKIDENQEVSQYLKDFQEYFFETMSHDCISFAELAKQYGVTNKISFVYQADLFNGAEFDGENVAVLGTETGAVQSDIVVMVIKCGKSYMAYAHYKKELYSEDFISSFISTYLQIIKSMLTAALLSDVELMDGDTEKILDGFNKTEKYYDKSKNVVDLFRESAAENPENIAVYFGEKTFTYKYVDELSENIACFLKSEGIGREDVVSILIPRCEYMAIASLGVLKAGAAYQPLDPTYPTDRLEFMMNDANAKYVIADDSLMDKIPSCKAPVLYTKDIKDLPKAKEKLPSPQGEDLLILLYTSGSTGVPKGCMLEHRNLTAFCNWYIDFYGVDATSRVAAYASYGFDACMMDMYPALTCGAATCIIPEEIRLDMPLLHKYFADLKITHSFMTTQLGRMFATMKNPGSLRHLSIGGERLVPLTPPEDYAFYNVYGPTECTIFSSAFRYDKNYTRVPIGKSLYNMKFYIVDNYLRRMPLYVPGELCISGVQVSRGYLRRPEQTERAYVKNPFTNEDTYDRIYRSGDVVRMTKSGDVDFIGRNDDQIKIRGFRVELNEVENKMMSMENIKSVKVIMRNNGKENYLAAFYTTNDGVSVTSADIKKYLKEIVPPYMIPSCMLQLKELPLNANGKIDKKKLPETDALVTETEYIAPENDREESFCEIFAEVLGLPRVGATDDFFDIGGTSLSAIKVVTHASELGFTILYRDIFKNPTPRELAAFVSNEDKAPAIENNLSDYDYTNINELISKNHIDCIDNYEVLSLHNIILTGATGFLGIHILYNFIRDYTGKVYCLMRKGNYPSCEKRLMALLGYYFSDTCDEYFGKRIICIDMEISDPEEYKALEGTDAELFINCAACVKHFSNSDILNKSNIDVVKNVIDFCSKTGMRLVQISTYSTGGVKKKELVPDVYHENMLYFGQTIDSDYSYSKFIGERMLLEAKANGQLDGYVVRVGNLMPRFSDGEFQMNFLTNNFMRRLKAFVALKQFPIETMNDATEISPIDCVANAILTLSHIKSDFSIFHAYNNHPVTGSDMLYALRDYGFNINAVTSERLAEAVALAKKDDNMSKTVLSLSAYDRADKQMAAVKADNAFTTELLYRLGFKWPQIDEKYLINAIEKLDTLNFFY